MRQIQNSERLLNAGNRKSRHVASEILMSRCAIWITRI